MRSTTPSLFDAMTRNGYGPAAGWCRSACRSVTRVAPVARRSRRAGSGTGRARARRDSYRRSSTRQRCGPAGTRTPSWTSMARPSAVSLFDLRQRRHRRGDYSGRIGDRYAGRRRQPDAAAAVRDDALKAARGRRRASRPSATPSSRTSPGAAAPDARRPASHSEADGRTSAIHSAPAIVARDAQHCCRQATDGRRPRWLPAIDDHREPCWRPDPKPAVVSSNSALTSFDGRPSRVVKLRHRPAERR